VLEEGVADVGSDEVEAVESGGVLDELLCLEQSFVDLSRRYQWWDVVEDAEDLVVRVYNGEGRCLHASSVEGRSS